MSNSPTPYEVAVSDGDIADLRSRLRNTRFPSDLGNAQWTYGVSRDYLESFVASWIEYDWKQTEREINALPNYRVDIDGIPVHFLHIRGEGENRVPLILTHGWPWTFWDYKDAIDPLMNPARYGAPSGVAFDLVIPSIPGFGFSTPLEVDGVNHSKVADLWAQLMTLLGYERFGVAAGDFGVPISAFLAHAHPERILGLHTLVPPLLSAPRPEDTDLDRVLSRVNGPTRVFTREMFAADEQHKYDSMRDRWITTLGHVAVQSTYPQTLGYALNDSPAGLAAWILEKRFHFSNSVGDPEATFTRKFLLDLVSIYWFTGSYHTSARLYYHSFRKPVALPESHTSVRAVPVGLPQFPDELIFMPRAVIERALNVVHWSPQEAGGHFAPSEVPQIWAADVRAFFEKVR